MDILWSWFVDLSRLSALAGGLYYIFFKKANPIQRLVFLLLCISFLADNINYFFIRLIDQNSFYVGNIYVILDFFLVVALFQALLGRRKIFLFGTILFVIGAIGSFSLFYGFNESNTFTRVYSNLFITIGSLLVYLELLKNPSLQLKKLPSFWITTSLFVYSSVVLLIALFNNYLIFDLKISSEGYAVIGIINLAANTGKNIIFFYALVLIDKGYPTVLNTTNS